MKNLNQVQEGSGVVLASGGPRMIVMSVADGMAECWWDMQKDSTKTSSHVFPVECLRLETEPTQEQQP